MTEELDILRTYLQSVREALLWKLEGLGDYDIRRPLTPTGTNLLGIVKHLAGVEAGYFGDVFGRPFDEELPWMSEHAEDNADMWATPEESRDEIIDLYRRVWAHADATFDALGPDAVGHVPWWGSRGEVTLRRVLIHVLTETARHTGQADIIRESIDGQAGMRRGVDNLPPLDEGGWREYHDRVQRAADGFR
ncbi:MAG TPA: DinB family protein [Propionibacteriaceae bacterium]|nr:DinB family protein [Propionibacteriaceae bacterium]